MGLFGVIITVAVMILGAGYFFLDSSGSHLSVENPAAKEQEIDNSQQTTGNKKQGTTENRLSVGMEALEKAKGIKEMAEGRAEEIIQEDAGSKEQEVRGK